MTDSMFFFIGLYYKHKVISYIDFRQKNLLAGFISEQDEEYPTRYINKLIKAGFIDRLLPKDSCEITEIGEREYLKEKNIRDKLSIDKEKESRKLNFDLKISKFTFYTYWITFAFSLAALIMSLISILRK